jgi:hypothetical protein
VGVADDFGDDGEDAGRRRELGEVGGPRRVGDDEGEEEFGGGPCSGGGDRDGRGGDAFGREYPLQVVLAFLPMVWFLSRRPEVGFANPTAYGVVKVRYDRVLFLFYNSIKQPNYRMILSRKPNYKEIQ